MNVLEKLKIELEEMKKLYKIKDNKDALLFTKGYIAGVIGQKNEDYCHLTDNDIKSLLNVGKGFFNKNFYFTFGSDERFPYQDGYLIVKAEDHSDAFRKFRLKYPDRGTSPFGTSILNCSFYYNEKQWVEVSHYYKNKKPYEIIE